MSANPRGQPFRWLSPREALLIARYENRASLADCGDVLNVDREAYRQRELGLTTFSDEEMDAVSRALYDRSIGDLVQHYRTRKTDVPTEMLQLQALQRWSNDDAAAILEISRSSFRQRVVGVVQPTGQELALLADAAGKTLFEAFPSYEPTAAELLLARNLAAANRLETPGTRS